jgi:hypothetical protein
MTTSTMFRHISQIPAKVKVANDTYVDSLTKWSVALELNPDGVGKSELFGVLVSVAMSMMLQGKTQEDFADWYQFSWAASEKLGRSNKRNKSDILQLTGTPSRDRVDKELMKAWDLATRNHQTKALPDVSALRQRLQTTPSSCMGGVVSTQIQNHGKRGRGRPQKSSLVALFDDMASERQRLNQEVFTYPCRPAAERLGISPMAVCNQLKRLVILGITEQVQKGDIKGLNGEGFAYAGRYRFITPAPITPPSLPTGGVVSTQNPDQGKCKPKKKKPTCKLPMKTMKKLDQVTSLTYQTVLDHGGDTTHWKRWLRHLDSHRLDSQEDRYRWVVAKNDPQGSVAVDAHQRRQELKTYEYLNRKDPGEADRRRMLAAGIPSGTTVTVRRVWVPGNYEYDGSYELVEAYRLPAPALSPRRCWPLCMRNSTVPTGCVLRQRSG